MNLKQRQCLGIGGVLLALLLGIGFWPTTVSQSYTTPSSSFSVDPNGRTQLDPPTHWSASAKCSILLGTTALSTPRMPMGNFVAEDLCGDRRGTRLSLILALIFTAIGTIVAVVWNVEGSRTSADLEPPGR